MNTRNVAFTMVFLMLLAQSAVHAAVTVLDINTQGRASDGFARLGSDSALLQERYLVFSGSDGLFFNAVFGREPWVHDLQTGETRLLADINPGSADSSPADFVALSSVVVFTAIDPEHGRELWATNGTPEGTVRLADIWPGPDSSSITGLTAILPNRAVFRANDGIHGAELWSTDGTIAGTQLLADINPGAGSSSPRDFVWLDGRLLFAANDGVNGTELWRWTPVNGAELVLDIRPGEASSSPFHLTPIATSFGNIVVFSATTDSDGAQGWRTDGTAAGTQQLFSIGNNSSPGEFVWHPGLNRLFFAATDDTHGRELWQFQAGVGASLVADITPGTASSNPGNLAMVEDQLALVVRGTDNIHRLYRYDGVDVAFVAALSSSASTTIQSIVLEEQFFARSSPTCHRWSPAGGHHTFACSSGLDLAGSPIGVLHTRVTSLEREIWAIDGDGTATQVTEFASFSSNPANFAWLDDRVFFSADDGQTGVELWVSDGTVAGTTLIDLLPGEQSSRPSQFQRFDNQLWFTAFDGSGTKLWFSDGTVAGTGRFDPDGLFSQDVSSDPPPLAFGSGLYAQLRDLEGNTRPARVAAADQPPVFLAFNGQPIYPSQWAAGAQRMYLIAYTDETGRELFLLASNGINLSALEIIEGSDDASPRSDSLVVWQDRAFFIARDINGEDHLWRSDGDTPTQVTGHDSGSIVGSRPVAGPGGVYFGYIGASGDCYLARAGADDFVLLPLPASSSCVGFDADNDDVQATDEYFYFSIRTDETGWELALTDGQAPIRVLDIRPGEIGSDPTNLVAAGSRLLFAADDGVHGRELWVAEGGRAVLVTDLRPGPLDSWPEPLSLRPDGKVAVVSAIDPVVWREPHWLDLERLLNLFSDRFEAP